MYQVIERHYGIEEVKGQSLKIVSELVVNEVRACVLVESVAGPGQPRAKPSCIPPLPEPLLLHGKRHLNHSWHEKTADDEQGTK